MDCRRGARSPFKRLQGNPGEGGSASQGAGWRTAQSGVHWEMELQGLVAMSGLGWGGLEVEDVLSFQLSTWKDGGIYVRASSLQAVEEATHPWEMGNGAWHHVNCSGGGPGVGEASEDQSQGWVPARAPSLPEGRRRATSPGNGLH